MATAATPKRSFKRTVASTVEERTPRFLLGSLALAMVISLVAGLGIGIKIGEHGKTTTKKPAAVVKKTPTTRKRVVTRSAFAAAPLKGTVVRKLPALMVLSRGRARTRVAMVRNTKFEATTKASTADIKPGSRVLFLLGRADATTTPTTGATPTSGTAKPLAPVLSARSILIISGAAPARLGSLVSAVTADSMTFKVAKGKTLTLSTVGAHVTKTIPATKLLLKAGEHVLIKSYQPKPTIVPKKGKKPRRVIRHNRVALEVVILPTSSAFG